MPLSDTSTIGLANRFHVVVDPGKHDLGSWQKVEGLDVSWEVADYRAGDSGNQRWFFPANSKYAPVRLLRAASEDSEKVKDWLTANSFHQDQSRVLVTITLCDSSGKAVLDWTLQNAVPKKWTVTSMDAGSSHVAVETLELEHLGFLDDQIQIPS